MRFKYFDPKDEESGSSSIEHISLCRLHGALEEGEVEKEAKKWAEEQEERMRETTLINTLTAHCQPSVFTT